MLKFGALRNFLAIFSSILIALAASQAQEATKDKKHDVKTV